ncbi:MAG: hypothetical protein Q8R02_21310 [Hyphomonadaceae bacterium]|nr:hypothetical protein [Hyphomonadaceae bacterium]
MTSLRTRIIIGVMAIGAALLAVLGDPLFQAMGAPPRAGRAIVMGFLLIVGVAFIGWTTWRLRADDSKSADARRNKITRS